MDKAKVGLQNAVARGTINRNEPDGQFAQVQTVGGRPRPETEVLQGQGVHFKAPDDADCLVLAPTGDSGNAVAVAAGDRAALPNDITLAPGEGGLHYLGSWKVYLAADGTLHLGAKSDLEPAPLDWVALASKVMLALLEIKDAFDNHTHTSGGSGNPTSTPTVEMPAPADVASGAVRCK
jgi:hypothetical protein